MLHGFKFFSHSPEIDISLSIPIYHKMLAYAKASNGEISGFGKTSVKVRKDISIVSVTDIRIFPQIVSTAHTMLTTDALSMFVVELDRLGECPSKWNLWWHSHNDFGVGFSREDEDTIKRISKDSKLYSICINKDGDLVGRFDQRGKEVRCDLGVVIEQNIDENLMKACKEEVKQKVKYSVARAYPVRINRPVAINRSTTVVYPGYIQCPSCTLNEDDCTFDRRGDKFICPRCGKVFKFSEGIPDIIEDHEFYGSRGEPIWED